MAHNDLVWPSGIVDGVTTGDGAEFEKLDQNAFESVNGDKGGTWSPTGDPIVIGGEGLSRTFESATFDDFDADPGGKRTFVRTHAFTPYTRLYGSAVLAAFGIPQGDGSGSCVSTILLVPHGATVTKVRAFFKVASGHSTLPATGPGISIQRIKPSDTPVSLTTTLLSTDPALFTLPGTVVAYEDSGNTQFVDYVPDQNNVIDNEQYYYAITMIDEDGGGAQAGNLYYGYEVTYTLAEDPVVY